MVNKSEAVNIDIRYIMNNKDNLKINCKSKLREHLDKICLHGGTPMFEKP